MLVWNYGLFENAQALLDYVEHGGSFLNQYTNYCPYNYRQSEVENIFYG